jgi:hypothetical protein
MDALTRSPGRWRLVRAFGHNPLVRTIDRIEAVVVALAVAILLIAAPVAGAVGTAVHDARSRVYAEAVRERHIVPAIVTATGQTAATAPRSPANTPVRAHWRVDGVEHTDAFKLDSSASAGSQIEIWVDSDGKRVSPPPAPSQAVVEAICAAVTIWLGVLAAAAALVAVVRWRLDRIRDAAWERELKSLAGNDGGLTNTQS